MNWSQWKNVLLALSLTACASTPAAKPYTPAFKYDPKVKPDDPKSDAVVAVIGAELCDKKHLGIPSFKTFCAAVNDTLEAIVNARGATVKRFSSWDDLVMSDKQTIHLALQPNFTELTLEANLDTSGPVGKNFVSGAPEQTYRATLSTGGSIKFEVLEPLSRSLLDKKKIELDDTKSSYEQTGEPGHKTGAVKYSDWDQRDWAFFNKSLEKHFDASMEVLDGWLSGAQLDVLKKQAVELKSKTGFQAH